MTCQHTIKFARPAGATAHAGPERFFRGAHRGPGRPEISVDTRGLYRDGRPWLAVMGELHYSRLDPALWKSSLLKMRAGGISVAASYVFWIHHEEVEGEIDFTGCRDLGRFARTCAEVDLPLVIRVGPWCHGEVRNGGLPDWILSGGCTPRSNDPAYLAAVRRWFGRIADQLRGSFWKDGGPIVAVQVENEYPGPSEHLLTLRDIARNAGLDAPLYTRTGWPTPSTPMPFGELLPLYGAYAEGFWAREITPMPGQHWQAFTFQPVRTDAEVGMDQLARAPRGDSADTPQYPCLTCEVGGGMEQSYHRRVLLDPRDTLAVVLTRLGAGSNLPGYYMYHGGTNPPGRRSTLQESQTTGYWNDVPVLSYDFQAPLGQYGQIREPYGLLRRLHLLLADFGEQLFRTSPAFPDQPVTAADDRDTLRWGARLDDHDAGFVFVSNYQRLLPMPARPDTTLTLRRASGTSVTFPSVTIPADASFVWPVNLRLAACTLHTATAQPLCRLVAPDTETLVLAQTDGTPVHLALHLPPGAVLTTTAHHTIAGHLTLLRNLPASRQIIATVRHEHRTTRLLVLSEADALLATKVHLAGADHLALAPGPVWADGRTLFAELHGDTVATLFLHSAGDTDFSSNILRPARPHLPAPSLALLSPAGPPRVIRPGPQHVAEAPTDADFDLASPRRPALYRIALPPDLPEATLCRVHYVADVARVYAQGRLITDQFFSGRPLDILITPGCTELELRLLPLQPAAPIYLHPAVRAALPPGDAIVDVHKVELLRRETVRLTL